MAKMDIWKSKDRHVSYLEHHKQCWLWSAATTTIHPTDAEQSAISTNLQFSSQNVAY